MKTKNIILSAIIATLPFAAWAENISGAMYTAPVHYDNNHPAPTTNAIAPFGRVNIDTDDQSHVATTAYVKGAYNSAIAAVNSALRNDSTGDIIRGINGVEDFVGMIGNSNALGGEDTLLSEAAIVQGFRSQRVEIYTTWDTNDTTDVAFKTVLPDD